MIISYEIPKPVDQVYPYLADLQKFKEVHPVIYKVDLLEGNEYLFFERIKFLYIPINFSYKVSLLSTDINKKVCMYSRVQPGVYLNLTFDLDSVADVTTVVETIKIKAPFIVKQIFSSVLKKAHYRFFENLKGLK